MIRIKLVAELEYEVSEETALDDYGTTDPQEMADIDLKNLEDCGFDIHVGGKDKVTYKAVAYEV